MSASGPFGDGNPFEGMPFLGDLAKLLMSSGPVNRDLARQLAVWIAAEGQPEANVDPLDRMRLEELARVAEMHVGTSTGLDTTSGGLLTVLPVTRSEWATRTLDAYAPLLEALATSLATPPGGGAGTGDAGDLSGAGLGERDDPDDAGLDDPAERLLGRLGGVLAPALMGMQAGSMVGHLAGRAFGQYGFPVPRPASDQLLVVPANIDAFAADWSLPIDDLRMWVLLEEIVHHAVLLRPHVRARLDELLRSYAAGFRPDPSGMEALLSGVDPTDPASLEHALADPEAVLGTMLSDVQHQVRRQLAGLVSALEGYVDHVMDTTGRRLVEAHRSLSEALRRRRVERSEGDRFVERLFGLELGQDQYDRGTAFVRGVVDRAGEDGLRRLWLSPVELPTPAEVDAPGLWLERIDLPGEP